MHAPHAAALVQFPTLSLNLASSGNLIALPEALYHLFLLA